MLPNGPFFASHGSSKYAYILPSDPVYGYWFCVVWFYGALFPLVISLLGQKDPEVKFHSIGIISDGVEEIITSLPVEEGKKGRLLFTLKEGVQYRLKLSFTVLHNIVSGLTCINIVWKGGIQGNFPTRPNSELNKIL